MPRYKQPSELTKAASDEDIDAILNALEAREYRIVGTAQRSLVGLWKMPAAAFVEAIHAHLQNGYRIFHKPIKEVPPDTVFFEANICLDPESGDEEEDVYVEIRLKNGTLVILCDAHNHDNWKPRLPK